MQVYGFDPDVDTASNAARRYCPRYFRLHRRPKPPPVSDGNERGLPVTSAPWRAATTSAACRLLRCASELRLATWHLRFLSEPSKDRSCFCCCRKRRAANAISQQWRCIRVAFRCDVDLGKCANTTVHSNPSWMEGLTPRPSYRSDAVWVHRSCFHHAIATWRLQTEQEIL